MGGVWGWGGPRVARWAPAAQDRLLCLAGALSRDVVSACQEADADGDASAMRICMWKGLLNFLKRL